MPKKKAVRLPPEATAVEPGGTEYFIQKSYSLLKSDACKALSNGAYRVYDVMLFAKRDRRTNHPTGYASGAFIFPYRYYSEWGISKKTVIHAIPELVEKGFIRVLLNGKRQRVDSVYCFSNAWHTWKKPQS